MLQEKNNPYEDLDRRLSEMNSRINSRKPSKRSQNSKLSNSMKIDDTHL